MERLTRRSKVGEGLPLKHLNLMHMDTTSEDTLTEILDKLADYEDTGLTPEDIEDIKAWLDVENDGKCGEDTLKDLLELIRYRKTGLTPEEITRLHTLIEQQGKELNRRDQLIRDSDKELGIVQNKLGTRN